MSRVSVIVVSFNTVELLRRCLASLSEAHEAIVVDNASGDGSADMVAREFPSAQLVRNERNRGFGAANNQGLDLASGDYALFLNSDAAATPGALARLASAMDADPSIVACGGRLQHEDGSLQESCCSDLTLWAVFCEQAWLEKAFPSSRVLSPYWLSRRLLKEGTETVHDVEQVMGACLMVRRAGPDQGFERFDERFFLYCEDTELCHRLRRHGRIVWIPDAAFVHALGASSQRRWEAVARYNRGKELYFRIHHGRAVAAACLVLDRLGALLRLIVWGVANLATLFLVRPLRARFVTFFRVLFAPVNSV